MIELTPLLAPLSTDAPAGQEARDSEAYEAIEAEIEKLSSMTGGGPIDWARIETLGQQILAEHSKDFLVASWLSAAWLQRHGIDGLSAGMQLQAGLVGQFWDTAYPGLKRLRGRRNALSWWLDRASDWLQDAELAPLTPELHTALCDAVAALDADLSEKDPESPPLGGLLRQVRQLDRIAPPDPESALTDTDAEPASASAQPDTAATEAPRAAAVAPAPAPASAALSAPGDLASLDDIERALAPASQYLSQVATALLALDRTHPLAIDMSRFAARTALLSLPPAQGPATALPAPPAAILDAFQSIVATGNAEGLIEFCESRIPAFPFWLDLDREAARGYAQLGPAGAAAHQQVVQHALAFTERLAGVEALRFADDTPFADEQTRQWLAQCREQQQGAAPTDAFEHSRQQAAAAAGQGQHDEAMRIYQGFMHGTGHGRDRFRARLALAELLLGTRPQLDAVPFTQALVDACDMHALSQWEPELAAQAWHVQLRALRQTLARLGDNEPQQTQRLKEAYGHAVRQLADVDFTLASQWA